MAACVVMAVIYHTSLGWERSPNFITEYVKQQQPARLFPQ